VSFCFFFLCLETWIGGTSPHLYPLAHELPGYLPFYLFSQPRSFSWCSRSKTQHWLPALEKEQGYLKSGLPRQRVQCNESSLSGSLRAESLVYFASWHGTLASPELWGRSWLPWLLGWGRAGSCYMSRNVQDVLAMVTSIYSGLI
jgi:hypothetical protein